MGKASGGETDVGKFAEETDRTRGDVGEAEGARPRREVPELKGKETAMETDRRQQDIQRRGSEIQRMGKDRNTVRDGERWRVSETP